MPKVEQYGPSRVSQRSPNPTKQRAPRVVDTTAPATRAAFDLAQAQLNHQNKVDEIEAVNAVNNYRREFNKLAFDTPDNGYQTKGENAYKNKEAFASGEQEIYDRNFDGLDTGARLNAERRFKFMQTNNMVKMDIHANDGLNVYENQLAQDSIEQNIESASYSYKDRKETDIYIRDMLNTVEGQAAKAGIDGQEAKENAMAAAVGAMVGNALAHQDIDGASQVMDDYGKMLGVEGGQQDLRNSIEKASKAVDAENEDERHTQTALDMTSTYENNPVALYRALREDVPAADYAKVSAKVNLILSNRNYAKSESIKAIADEVGKHKLSGKSVDSWAVKNPKLWEALPWEKQQQLLQTGEIKTSRSASMAMMDAVNANKLTPELVKQWGGSLSGADFDKYYAMAGKPESFNPIFSTKERAKIFMKDMSNEEQGQYTDWLVGVQYEADKAGKPLTDIEMYDMTVKGMTMQERPWYQRDVELYKDDATGRQTVYNERFSTLQQLNPDMTKEDTAEWNNTMERYYDAFGYYPSEQRLRESHEADLKAKGIIKEGTIDLSNHEPIRNDDGSYSTVSTISVGVSDGVMLLPTVYDGKRHENKESIDRAVNEGKFIGIFKDEESAEAYAKELSAKQGAKYIEQEAVREEQIKAIDAPTEAPQVDKKAEAAKTRLGFEVQAPTKTDIYEDETVYKDIGSAIMAGATGGNHSAPQIRPKLSDSDTKEFIKQSWLRVKSHFDDLYIQKQLRNANDKDRGAAEIEGLIAEIREGKHNPYDSYALAHSIQNKKHATAKQKKFSDDYVTVYRSMQ